MIKKGLGFSRDWTGLRSNRVLLLKWGEPQPLEFSNIPGRIQKLYLGAHDLSTSRAGT